jgi:hypothetical protein
MAAAILFVTSGPVRAATLVGTQVTGSLDFIGYMRNFFDPANGGVPAGYLNAAGTTVTISSNAVEFGFSDGTATVTADFTGTQLIVTDQPLRTGQFNPMQMVFTDSAFTNLSAASDSFPNGGLSGSLAGAVITLNWSGGNLTNGQSVQAVFNVNVPASPRLDIQLTSANTVVISWPAPSTGFNLQQNSSFNPTTWADVTTTPAVVNGRNQVLVSAPIGTRFYRLKFS